MINTSLSTLTNASWCAYSDEAILKGNILNHKRKAASLLLVKDSPNNKWNMFSSSLFGLSHYVSGSGFNYQIKKFMMLGAKDPHLYKEDNLYHLLYVRHIKSYDFKTKTKDSGYRICLKSSYDLQDWSSEKVLLRSINLFGKEVKIEDPCLVKIGREYRLYFAYGEKTIYDTNKKVPQGITYASSGSLDSSFVFSEKSILRSLPDDKYTNLGIGKFRIVQLNDGFAALNISYYYDKEKDKSQAVIRLLSSEDGIVFKQEKVVFYKPDKGWASYHISSIDAQWEESEKTWYCIFTASYKKGLFSIWGTGLLLASNR